MLFEFALASLVFIAVPGPDQALITRNALLRGRAAGCGRCWEARAG